nr:MAG TPA: hypothetical protein [Bacteriophage sp.]
MRSLCIYFRYRMMPFWYHFDIILISFWNQP